MTRTRRDHEALNSQTIRTPEACVFITEYLLQSCLRGRGISMPCRGFFSFS
jgi:hypothetical protein